MENVGAAGSRGAFHLGARGEALFFRRRGADMGFGPYVDVATAAFRALDAGVGGAWLIPVRDDLPIVLSAGPLLRETSRRNWMPGAEGTLFWGSRSYNFHSAYAIAAGVFVQGRWISSPPAAVDVVIGAQVDAELLALPLILAYEAIAGRR